MREWGRREGEKRRGEKRGNDRERKKYRKGKDKTEIKWEKIGVEERERYRRE